MKKYKTGHLSITPVEVERESSSSVWIGGRVSRKLSDYESYFDTFEEAKAHLVKQEQWKVTNASSALNYAERRLKQAEELKP